MSNYEKYIHGKDYVINYDEQLRGCIYNLQLLITRNIIKLSPVKSCELYSLPIWILNECIAELVPLITDIVNMSLRESMISRSLKTALIRPVLKEKTGLDSDILKNYRLVSNLLFISKVIKNVI